MEEKMTTAEEPAAKPRGIKLPQIDIVKPRPWDFIALAVLVAGAVLTGVNLMIARGTEQGAISGGATAGFVVVQLLVCIVGLMVLGKTAKEGTIWGNLFAVGACFVGMSGVLLASALWALA
jgi:hypothetical protein